MANILLEVLLDERSAASGAARWTLANLEIPSWDEGPQGFDRIEFYANIGFRVEPVTDVLAAVYLGSHSVLLQDYYCRVAAI
jgi:hypothetical protein